MSLLVLAAITWIAMAVGIVIGGLTGFLFFIGVVIGSVLVAYGLDARRY